MGPGDYMMTLALILPGAASVASPPLVVGGMLVGLLLLGSFAYMLSRTFQNMSAIQPENRLQAATGDTTNLTDTFQSTPSVDVLHALVDGLRESETDEEAQVYVAALTDLTGRFFKSDVVAWESWLRREGERFVSNTDTERRAPVRSVALPLSS